VIIRLYVFVFLVFFTMSGLAPVRAQGNVVVNGDFENGGGTLNGWMAGSDPGFPVTYAAEPGIQTNGPQINHFALISGSAVFPLVQDVATIPGAYYCLSLSLISFSGTNYCDVSAGAWSTTLLFPATPFQINNWTTDTTNWQNFIFTFQAVATNTSVSIFYHAQVLSLPNPPPMTQYYGAGGLDSVSVALVPEPMSWALISTGGLIWLACKPARRRR
jgi:hypothetical protein